MTYQYCFHLLIIPRVLSTTEVFILVTILQGIQSVTAEAMAADQVRLFALLSLEAALFDACVVNKAHQGIFAGQVQPEEMLHVSEQQAAVEGVGMSTAASISIEHCCY